MRALAFVLTLALALPAHAVDCNEVEATEVGKPLSDAQARCIQAAIVNLRYEAERDRARATEYKVQRDACEATAAITCPPAEPPVIPVVVAALSGFVVGVALIVTLLVVRP